MKAILLAAGMGTRLLPLTEELPKALFPVVNRPIIDIIIDRLKGFEVDRVGINLHHLPEEIQEHVGDGGKFGITVDYSYEDQILETGGGLANFVDFIGDDTHFIVHNCDILSDINIMKALQVHEELNPLATFVLVDAAPKNTVLVDRYNRVLDVAGRLSITQKKGDRLLCGAGIFIYSSEIFHLLPQKSRPYPIIPVLMSHLRQNPGSIMAYVPEEPYYWRDIGNPVTYQRVHQEILEGKAPPIPGIEAAGAKKWIHPDAKVAEGVEFTGFASVGAGACIEQGAHLMDCIVWKNACVPAGAEKFSSIITEANCMHI